MILFLFWFIRLCCLAGMIVSLVLVRVSDFWSGLFTVLGVFAAIEIYAVGLLKHETIKSLPSLFILLRFFQLVILLLTSGIMWQYLAIYTGIDAFVFILFIIDNRYDFIEKEDINTKAKTLIRRD